MKRERDAKLMDLHSGSPWETLTLTTLSASRDLFASLLSEARALAEASTEGKTVVYTAWGVEWRPFGKPRRRREMGSVVLAEGIAERVKRDLKEFLGRAKWYAERGKRWTIVMLRWSEAKGPLRNTVPTRISASWPAWIRQDELHPSASRGGFIQYLLAQPR